MKSKNRCASDACYKVRNPSSEFCQYHDPKTQDTAGLQCAAQSKTGKRCMRLAHPDRAGAPSIYCRAHQVAMANMTPEERAREEFMRKAQERFASSLAATRARLERTQ